MNAPSGLKVMPVGAVPCRVNTAPVGVLSLVATVLARVCPACTAKASFCGAGVTTTVTRAVSQLAGAAASQTW
ncbi:hypothetical protein D3C71_994750 [compost metagenome]